MGNEGGFEQLFSEEAFQNKILENCRNFQLYLSLVHQLHPGIKYQLINEC